MTLRTHSSLHTDRRALHRRLTRAGIAPAGLTVHRRSATASATWNAETTPGLNPQQLETTLRSLPDVNVRRLHIIQSPPEVAEPTLIITAWLEAATPQPTPDDATSDDSRAIVPVGPLVDHPAPTPPPPPALDLPPCPHFRPVRAAGAAPNHAKRNWCSPQIPYLRAGDVILLNGKQCRVIAVNRVWAARKDSRPQVRIKWLDVLRLEYEELATGWRRYKDCATEQRVTRLLPWEVRQ